MTVIYLMCSYVMKKYNVPPRPTSGSGPCLGYPILLGIQTVFYFAPFDEMVAFTVGELFTDEETMDVQFHTAKQSLADNSPSLSHGYSI